MSLFFPSYNHTGNKLERRLMSLAVMALFIFSLILSLSPAVRMHSWTADYRWMHWLGYAVWLAGFALTYRQLNKRLAEHDPILLPVTALLSGWGLMTIWRLDGDFGLRQTLWLAAGFGLFGISLRLPKLLSLLRRYKYIWLTAGLLLTTLTFIFGQYPGGTGPRLWLGCCGIYFQPSEPLKLLLIIYLAAYLADHIPTRLNLIQLLAPTVVLTGTAALILIAQRDLGTATLIITLYAGLVFIASGKKRILITSGVTLLAAALAGTLFFDVIRLRVDAWLNPWLDPSGSSFQIVQSLIAVAAGGVVGSGPGLGSPGFVPVAHSDFIAIAMAEETGLMGIIALLCLLALLVMRGLIISLKASNNFQRYLAAGLSIYFATQSLLILAGNFRLLPLTGVTLPFVSYGGSSFITSMVSVILLFSIRLQDDPLPAASLNSRPYLLTSGIILAAFSALALLAGWWSVIRSDALLSRNDNLRWIVNDRFVERGSLLDRRNTPLAYTTGTPGNFVRQVGYPLLGNTIGYASYQYGRAGLESTLDAYLSGRQGNPGLTVWTAQLLYSQLPAGLDVRLSIDLELQKTADQLLDGQVGALVLLNAGTGEILALASHPSFDPNRIGSLWQDLHADPRGPLVNRVSQGMYPPGSVLAPFIYARVRSSQSGLPALPHQLSYQADGLSLQCAQPPDAPLSWESAVAAGCPGAVAELSAYLTPNQLRDLFRSLGFFSAPDVRLPVARPAEDAPIMDVRQANLGLTDLRVTPLQLALAAAAFSNDGIRPSPRLAISVQTPHQGWVILPTDAPVSAMMYRSLDETVSSLASSSLPAWDTTALAYGSDQEVSWYIGGTLPSWGGTPIAIAVVLEIQDARSVKEIGQSMLLAAMQPARP